MESRKQLKSASRLTPQVETRQMVAPNRPMGRQTATPKANQAPTKSCLSSDGCPSPGLSRPAGTKPQRREPSAGTQPSGESLSPPLLLLLLGAASQRQTEAEHSRDLCRPEPGALALEPVPCSDPSD